MKNTKPNTTVPSVDENGNVHLEYNDVDMDPLELKNPIIMIPKENLPSSPYQYQHTPSVIHMDNMKTYMNVANYNYETYLSYMHDMIEQCIDVIEQNCNIIYTAGILSILKRFAHNNDYVEQFIDTHKEFYNRSRCHIRNTLAEFCKGIVIKKFNPDFFIYNMAKIKADFSRVENDFLNHIMSTIFSKKIVDTYGFACYIASISNINIEDENLACNDGTALGFALTGSAEFTKYDAGRISEAVEVNIVYIFYSLLDLINKYNITKPEEFNNRPNKYGFPIAKRVDIIDEDMLKQIIEDDEIEEENLE